MRQLSATLRSVTAIAASFGDSRDMACKYLFAKNLPVNPLNPRICEGDQQSRSRKSNESNILQVAAEKFRIAHDLRNSFITRILRVNYLESRICEGHRALACKQLQQNQDFANSDPRKIVVASSASSANSALKNRQPEHTSAPS